MLESSSARAPFQQHLARILTGVILGVKGTALRVMGLFNLKQQDVARSGYNDHGQARRNFHVRYRIPDDM